MKFSGKIAFLVNDIETSPGIWESGIVVRKYVGDFIYVRQTITDQQQVNNKIIVNNRLKIVADIFLRNNFSTIEYVEWRGQKLKVSSITIDHPSVTLELGGAYHEAV